ncbi:MAG: nucleotidyltransferase family protein [Nitrospinae bacterium]|nr:nucleotidyltransferase family protein [Nitrospinota bacterium]
MNRKTIIQKIEVNRDSIRRFGVRKLGLFGSHARGQGTRKSDLDFIVEFDVKSFDAYMDLKFYLEKLFKRPVDLVLSDAIKPRLRPIILKEAVHVPGL